MKPLCRSLLCCSLPPGPREILFLEGTLTFSLRPADERIGDKRRGRQAHGMDDEDQDNDAFFARPPRMPSGRLQLASGRK